MKILLLGIGRWGANHLRVLHALPVELFVADLDASQLAAAAALGLDAAHLSTNYRDFAGQVDAAVIVTPAPTHFALCRELLAAGKDVFVEKPLTTTSAEAQTLVELADKHHRILQVGHIFRCDPASQWLRFLLDRCEEAKGAPPHNASARERCRWFLSRPEHQWLGDSGTVIVGGGGKWCLGSQKAFSQKLVSPKPPCVCGLPSG